LDQSLVQFTNENFGLRGPERRRSREIGHLD
jgi:hypothetical protein